VYWAAVVAAFFVGLAVGRWWSTIVVVTVWLVIGVAPGVRLEGRLAAWVIVATTIIVAGATVAGVASRRLFGRLRQP